VVDPATTALLVGVYRSAEPPLSNTAMQVRLFVCMPLLCPFSMLLALWRTESLDFCFQILFSPFSLTLLVLLPFFQALVLLSSVRRSLFRSEPERAEFLQAVIGAIHEILRDGTGDERRQ
jgi:hypothetical protein